VCEETVEEIYESIIEMCTEGSQSVPSSSGQSSDKAYNEIYGSNSEDYCDTDKIR